MGAITAATLHLPGAGGVRLTLCLPMDCSLPGSSAHGIFQARILEWVAISFSRDLSLWVTVNLQALL